MLEIRKKNERERGLSTRDTASFHGPGHLKSSTNLLPLTKLISTKYSSLTEKFVQDILFPFKKKYMMRTTYKKCS